MCCAAKIWMFTCGGIFGVIGVILAIFWPSWSVDIMYSLMPLAPGSFLYRHWVETPVPLYMVFYLYNWSNPDQVTNPNVKPHFTEHGPYVFIDRKEKKIQEWNDADSTLTYVDFRTWTFQPQLSGGSADDIIVAPHFPSVCVSKITRDLPKTIRKVANFTLEREGGALTMTATAMEWLFDSFYDDIFDFVYRLHSPLAPLESGNFAFFLNRNGSTGAEGNFTIHTGKSDVFELANLKKWKGKSHTGVWDGDCGKVNGTSGELYTPGKPWSAVTTILIPEVQRFINLYPKTEVDYKGIKAWRYESTDQTFDSGYVAPDTKCFCAQNKPCPAPGAIDFSPAMFGAPLYVSHPHFYLADPSYLENITGLTPNHDEHVSFLIIEPVLAAPLQASGQAFVTILVEQDEAIDLFKDLAHNFYAPLLRVDIRAEITDDLIGIVKLGAYAPAIGQIVGIIFAVGAAIVLIIAIVFTLTHRWDNKVPPQPLENERSDDSIIDTHVQPMSSLTEENELPKDRAADATKVEESTADNKETSKIPNSEDAASAPTNNEETKSEEKAISQTNTDEVKKNGVDNAEISAEKNANTDNTTNL